MKRVAMAGVVAGEAFVLAEDAKSASLAGACEVRARVRHAHIIDELAEDGRLRAHQVAAARDIEAYVAGWIVPIGRSSGGMAERVDGGGAAGGGEPASVRLRAARYRAWAEWAEGQRVKPELSLLTITLKLCVDGWTPRAIRREYGMDDGRALRLIQEGLLHYADLAGWVEDREAA
ncbi:MULTISPECIES: hypothetical protein [Roseomonadaceae]|uniref:Uncharacterized protein n=1 Tax=Falsiroseomonas oleicola TaxID=2801474 RepID=A0ABS6H5Q0_9PROT|nr:hypothetical protein [Roseomonas oleicola]MBU8543984.1 hypothetical protein [Roseomonas oleicola]